MMVTTTYSSALACRTVENLKGMVAVMVLFIGQEYDPCHLCPSPVAMASLAIMQTACVEVLASQTEDAEMIRPAFLLLLVRDRLLDSADRFRS